MTFTEKFSKNSMFLSLLLPRFCPFSVETRVRTYSIVGAGGLTISVSFETQSGGHIGFYLFALFFKSPYLIARRLTIVIICGLMSP